MPAKIKDVTLRAAAVAAATTTAAAFSVLPALGAAGEIPAASAVSAAAVSAPVGTAAAATETVSYLGHKFTVPAAWPVVDLTADPSSCVRFDQHALYLGAPGSTQDCPSHIVGKTDALLVEPAPAGARSVATTDAVDHDISSTAGGLTVTAGYSDSPGLIDGILAGAGLPQPAAAVSGTGPASASASAAPQSRTAAMRPLTATVPTSATNFTGEAFDPCTAPSTSVMNAWKASSPFGAIGVYIGGVNRGCSQPNLTASWVAAQAAAGWHFFLLYVGPQDPNVSGGCATSCSKITSPVSNAQACAQDAAAQAASLGFGPGTPIVYDMEGYDPAGTGAALSFIAQWTASLHALGYKGGEYSSSDSGIHDLVQNVGSYTMPDMIDLANWNGTQNTYDSAVPALAWAVHQRIHQYNGNVTQTFGGYQLSFDGDYMDVGDSAVTPPMPAGGTLGDVNGDGRPDLLVADSSGNLQLYPSTGLGTSASFSTPPTQVGTGWTGYRIGAVADLYHSGHAGILAIDPTGNLYYYANSGGSGLQTFPTDTQVGNGWSSYRIVGLTDLYGTGRAGILAVDPTGALLYYPNIGGTGTATFGVPVTVGSGWLGYTVDVSDMDGDGKPDLLAVNASGSLLYYPNIGGGGTGTFGWPVTVGSGWTGFQAVDTADVASATRADIVAMGPSGELLLYANLGGTSGPRSADPMFGSGTVMGSGWAA